MALISWLYKDMALLQLCEEQRFYRIFRLPLLFFVDSSRYSSVNTTITTMIIVVSQVDESRRVQNATSPCDLSLIKDEA